MRAQMFLYRELMGLGGTVAAVGLQHICMTIPTICMLPYRQYTSLHMYNMFVALVMMGTGVAFFKTSRKMESLILFNRPANINRAVRLSLALASITVSSTLYGFGVGPKFDSDGIFHQVLAEARHPEWGRCVELTEDQVSGLCYLYQFISMSYSFNIFTVVATTMIAVVNWDRVIGLMHQLDDIEGKKTNVARLARTDDIMPIIVEEDEKLPVLAVTAA